MIDLTMDDEEKADGDAHAASDSKHTELLSNATSSHSHEDLSRRRC